MLAGVVDFFADKVLAGWVKGPHAVEISISALVGDQRIAGAGIRDPQQADVIRFRVAMPQPVLAADLASGRIVIEARTAGESIILDLWEPILVAAELNNMERGMLERVVGSLTPAKLAEFTDIFGGQIVQPQPGRPTETSIYDDLMRWS